MTGKEKTPLLSHSSDFLMIPGYELEHGHQSESVSKGTFTPKDQLLTTTHHHLYYSIFQLSKHAQGDSGIYMYSNSAFINSCVKQQTHQDINGTVTPDTIFA